MNHRDTESTETRVPSSQSFALLSAVQQSRRISSVSSVPLWFKTFGSGRRPGCVLSVAKSRLRFQAALGLLLFSRALPTLGIPDCTIRAPLRPNLKRSFPDSEFFSRFRSAVHCRRQITARKNTPEQFGKPAPRGVGFQTCPHVRSGDDTPPFDVAPRRRPGWPGLDHRRDT